MFEDKLKEMLHPFVGKNLTYKTLMEIKHQIIMLIHEYFDGNNENFKIYISYTDDNKIEIRPVNIFTALLMYDCYRPYELVKDLDEYYVEGIGLFKKGNDGYIILNERSITN